MIANLHQRRCHHAGQLHTPGRLPLNDAVRIVERDGRSRLVLTALDRLPEPDTLIALKQAVGNALPRVDLPEALLEIEAHTGFCQAFAHVYDKEARGEDFPATLCAVLMAEACNIALEPVVHGDIPALTRGRLNWVRQNYLRSETIARANTCLVNQQAQLPLAQCWGGGEVASVDGPRFRVPDRAVHAGPNPKYFGLGRGVTFLNFVSDQYSGFHNVVVPGTLRDSLFLLEGLLEQESDLDPRELMTDTAGASAIVFRLFWMLGYQFSPRLADIGGARSWRIDRQADYGPLNDVPRHRINVDRILNHWDDMLRIAGSLKLGRIRASKLIPHPVGNGVEVREQRQIEPDGVRGCPVR